MRLPLLLLTGHRCRVALLLIRAFQGNATAFSVDSKSPNQPQPSKCTPRTLLTTEPIQRLPPRENNHKSDVREKMPPKPLEKGDGYSDLSTDEFISMFERSH